MNNQTYVHFPISEKKRIKDIDVIRGFALFGVLLVNVVCFNTTFPSIMVGHFDLANPLQISPGLDRYTAILISFFAEGKFYTIFSFLFGLGFYIFISRAEGKGLDSRPLFKRRMFALFLFGLSNLFLVWWGDILHVYALGGSILLLFKDKPVKVLKRWVLILLIFTTLVSSLFFSTSPLTLQALETQVDSMNYIISPHTVEQSFEVFKNGTYWDIVGFRLTGEIPYVLFYLFFIIPKTLAMFLIGMIAGKMSIFEKIEGNLKFINNTWKVTGLAGCITLAGMLVTGYPLASVNDFLQGSLVYGIFYAFFYELGTVFLSLFYVTSLLKLLKKKMFSKILYPLQHPGRMALTNYLVQCLVCSLVFYGHGLGYMGRIGIFAGVVFTVAFFALQVVISNIWFKHYSFGPLEYIWRKYTYSRIKKESGIAAQQ